MRLFSAVIIPTSTQAGERPNILWITLEDVSPTLGCYGDPYATTPNMDSLAQQGVLFSQAFAPTGVCATARSSLITGMYASSIGTQHMRSVATLPDSIAPFPNYLREAGYYCSNNSKTDYNFVIPDGAWDESSKAAHWRNRKEGQPFFSVFNFLTTHESRIRGYEDITSVLSPNELHDPSKANLPPFLPDTEAVRQDWARYHDLLTTVDKVEIPKLLNQLEEDGLREDTIVFLFSDHGVGLPRAKQFIFDSGMQVPLIVYFPKKWQHLAPGNPSTSVDALVSFIDFAPTVLKLAGIAVPGPMEGIPFAGTQVSGDRQYIYGIRDRMDERIDMNRTVRDRRFKYHRNYMPYLPHFPWLDYMEKLETSKAFRRLGAEGRLADGLNYFMGDRKELEELYDLENDPWELNNLADDPEYEKQLKRLRKEHFAWSRKTRDTGFIPEQMLRDFADGSSEYDYAQSHNYQLERCIEAVRLLEDGGVALSRLKDGLSDSYPPVRFWSGVGLSNLGTEAQSAETILEKTLNDPFPEVAIAAAEALCHAQRPEAALPVLAKYVKDSRPIVRLAAANVLDRVDELALDSLDLLRAESVRETGDDPANLNLMGNWALARAVKELDEMIAQRLTNVGVARIDITPQKPIRLHGFPREAARINDVSEVAMPIYAKALAFGSDEEDPVLLVSLELLGVSDEQKRELMRRLTQRVGFDDPSKLTIAATHNHSAPAISSVAPFVFRKKPTPGQARRIADYEAWLMDRLEEVAVQALDDRKPALMEYGRGSVDFAINRQIIKDGKWVGFGDNEDGPVDHDVPMLSIRNPDGTLRAVWLSYACHGIAWRKPSIHGDWMGNAMERIEANHPGTIALMTIGCAGDQSPRKWDPATGNDVNIPGKAIADEVNRILENPLRNVTGVPSTRISHFELPLGEIKGLEYWKEQQDWYSQTVYERLKSGKPVAKSIPYQVQTWNFGTDLAIVFLAGEVFVDYGLRLKKELDESRIWINSYANDVPAYIPPAHLIDQGGFEIDTARLHYGLPARIAHEAEDIIIKATHDLLSADFHKESKEKIEAEEDAWWKNTGHPKGKWWTDYPGYEGAAADEIWERIEIPESPVLSPEEALDAFELVDGYKIELVAAEPLIVRPVHMEFDPAGRLWVVEMPGYMRDIAGTGENDPTGRVVVLEDTNGDGRMDKSTAFLEGLVMPRTVALVEGGALVVEPPKIWYAQDKDGDLVADEKILLVDDYGVEGNPEHSANGLYRALDNWYYSAKSSTRYRFEGGQLRAEETAFRGQWGISQDDTGQLYYNYNASPLHTELVSANSLMSEDGIDYTINQNVLGRGLVNVNLVEDKSVYPARVTPLVTLGASDLRPDGTLKQFSAACSPHIYRGHQYPDKVRGDAFVCDPVGNLIKHFKMKKQGLEPIAIPAYSEKEFLASTDERFRPVFLQQGPDGALYLADMYTGIIEHKRYVTEYLRNQLLSRGLDRYTETGRIYRIVSTKSPPKNVTSLAGQDGRELLSALSSLNGWTRDRAQQLLIERRDRTTMPQLRSLALKGSNALGRLHALWTLEGMDALDFKTVSKAMEDDDLRVRVTGLRLSENYSDIEKNRLAKLYRKLLKKSPPDVALQILLSARNLPVRDAMDIVAGIIGTTDDWRTVTAAASSLSGFETNFIVHLLNREDWVRPSPVKQQLLGQLGFTVMTTGVPSEITTLLDQISEIGKDDWKGFSLLHGVVATKINPVRVRLGAKPKLVSYLEQNDGKELALELGKRVTWPGNPVADSSMLEELTQSEQALFELGKTHYQLICAACHQPDGQGMIGVAPPLAGSSWVEESFEIPAKIVLHGLQGPIEVSGEKWDLPMLGFGSNKTVLNDEKIAGILTYIRREWGNQGTPVYAEEVSFIRKIHETRRLPWTAQELIQGNN